MLMPVEGPIIWNQPMPDFSNNRFCLGCHTQDAASAQLTIEALVSSPDNVDMVDDHRRLPMTYPKYMHGHLPPQLNPSLANECSNGGSASYIDCFLAR